MEKKNSIVQEIFKNYTLSNNEVELINSKFKKIELKRGDVLVKPNTVIQHQYYIYSGCLQSYFVQKSGKENTIQFAIKEWWISDYTSLFTNQKSVLNIEYLQDAVLYRVSKKDIDEVFEKILKLETFF